MGKIRTVFQHKKNQLEKETKEEMYSSSSFGTETSAVAIAQLNRKANELERKVSELPSVEECLQSKASVQAANTSAALARRLLAESQTKQQELEKRAAAISKEEQQNCKRLVEKTKKENQETLRGAQNRYARLEKVAQDAHEKERQQLQQALNESDEVNKKLLEENTRLADETQTRRREIEAGKVEIEKQKEEIKKLMKPTTVHEKRIHLWNDLLGKSRRKNEELMKDLEKERQENARLLAQIGKDEASIAALKAQFDENNTRPILDAKTKLTPTETSAWPNDTEKLPDDRENLPDDTEKLPDDTEKLPDDTEKLPDDTEKLPDDTEKLPDDTENLSDDADKFPDDTFATQQDDRMEREHDENRTRAEVGMNMDRKHQEPNPKLTAPTEPANTTKPEAKTSPARRTLLGSVGSAIGSLLPRFGRRKN